MPILKFDTRFNIWDSSGCVMKKKINNKRQKKMFYLKKKIQ